VKALWVDSNAIREIEGLDTCVKLCALYLNNNCISRIRGLEMLTGLHTLNLSHNVISQLSNLRHLPRLETLMLTHNRISRLADLEELLHCPALTCVDLSHNPLEREEGAADDAVVDFFVQMQKLAVLYLTGTEIVKTLRFYRRKMISRIATLQYLDERPVFDEERRCATAWATGGEEAETLERNKIHEEKKDKLTRDVRALQTMANEKKELKANRTAEWEEMQKKEVNYWKSRTECFRDLGNEEGGIREDFETEEDDQWKAFMSAHEVESASIEDEAKAIRNAQEEKERAAVDRKKQLEALRTPLEDSRRELLAQVALWGADGPSDALQSSPADEEEDDCEEDGLLKEFQREVHAALYDLTVNGHSTSSVAPIVTPNSPPNAPVPTKRWRHIAMGDWSPPPSTLAVWNQFEKWESTSRR
jgi:dynein assembly factor 1